ncbi:hypothetical protein YC2023_005264 [Brassica napus]
MAVPIDLLNNPEPSSDEVKALFLKELEICRKKYELISSRFLVDSAIILTERSFVREDTNTSRVEHKIICKYSGTLKKFLGKSTCSSDGNMKVIFNDFPRGVECFELVSRFATATSEKCMKEISRQLMDALVEKLELSPSSAASACSPSPDSSLLRFSCDSKSTESFKNGSSRIPWWFSEVLVLCPSLVAMFLKLMIARKFDNLTISRFLFYYQKVKLCSESCNEKREILETIIHTLYVLDRSCVRHKSLFGVLRLALALNIKKSLMNKAGAYDWSATGSSNT